MVSKFCMLPPLQSNIELALEFQSIRKVSRRMQSLFEIRAVPSLFLLVLIQMSVLACMFGIERYSCCSFRKFAQTWT